jgi:hypothetical protein
LQREDESGHFKRFQHKRFQVMQTCNAVEGKHANGNQPRLTGAAVKSVDTSGEIKATEVEKNDV